MLSSSKQGCNRQYGGDDGNKFSYILSVSLLSLCLSQKVYYVKPAESSSSECPSGSLDPCHSLQYYADYTNFTSNSLFLIFLPGEHHLDSVVEINKVANLSLEGVNSEVKIFCSSFPSFWIQH